MIAPVNRSRAPWGCRWMLSGKRSDFLRASNSPGGASSCSRFLATRALCIRIPEVPRMVTEPDGHGCTCWEPADTRESEPGVADADRSSAESEIRQSP